MITYFDNILAHTLFDNIQEDFLLISFLNESVNNDLGQEMLKVLKEFDLKCIKEKKHTNIIWFISPEFQIIDIKKLWEQYNPNLTVPYLKFVTKKGISTNIGFAGMPSVSDLFNRRNLL